MRENSVLDLIRFFSSKDSVMGVHEFARFWDTLKPEEKKYYRTVDLNKM